MTIRINALPEATNPAASSFLAVDGATTEKATLQKVVDAGAPVASEAEARAGADNAKRMTALRVKQSIDEEIGNTIASAASGALANTAVQPGDLGDSAGLDVGTTAGTVAAGDDGRIVLGRAEIQTFSAAGSIDVPSEIDRVYVVDRRGYFTAAESEPAHPIKFQSGGRWFEPDLKTVQSPVVAGAVLDGVADDTQAYRDFTDWMRDKQVRVADLGKGIALCSKVITLPPAMYVDGDITFDFSAVDNDAEFPDQVCLDCAGSDPVALPALAADPVEGGYQLTFGEAPDLEPGDLICIYNAADYSLNGFRSYYKAGEWCRVLDVSGTTVALIAPLNSGYTAADVDIYRYGEDSVSFSGGKVRVLASQAVLYGARFWRLQRSFFDGVDVFGAADTEIQWYECVECVGRGIETGKDGLVLTSYYGGYVANCQGMRLDGNWRGGRHGITLTGTGDDGFITPPTRDISISGECWNMPNTDDAYHSFNAHGNVLGYTADCIFHNGISLGGDKGRIEGRIETFRDNDFGAIAFLEQHGTDFTVDADIYTLANPNNKSRGVIDIGGNSSAITDDTVKGGYYRFSGTMRAPNAGRLFRMRNRGATGLKIGVDLSGLKIAEAAVSGSSTSVQADAVSGDVISELDLTGFKLPDGHGWGVDTVTRIYGWRRSIKTSVDTATGVSTVSKAETINAPKIPCVAASIGDATPGGKPDAAIAFNGSTLSRTSVTFILASASGNFTAAETVPVHLSLSVDE